LADLEAWGADTTWRQGLVIPAAAIVWPQVKADQETADSLYVVISHNCDLVSSPSDEPYVEYIVGSQIDECKSGYVHAQSPYCLHIELIRDGAQHPVALYATRKEHIRKVDLSGHKPDPHFSIGSDELVVLQTWLSARYRRAALHDELYKRLAPVRDKLADAGKRKPLAICGIYLQYDPEMELTTAEPYELWLRIVYSTLVPDAKGYAEEAAAKLQAAFEKRYKTGGSWQRIDLRECVALADTEFTLRDMATFKQWRLEHISVRMSPPGPIF
jgi:hypothetical protein